ncbi:MAG: CHAD domain-containing protein [Verrucomicrobiota bacterium]
MIRVRAHELSGKPEAGTEEQDWLGAERELSVVHDYDTIDFDLERLGMTVSRRPVEAGVMWELRLPLGEVVEAWEPGNTGLAPPEEIARLIEGVVAGRPLLPMPPLSPDEGAIRLRKMIDAQRRALLEHDPGTRLGDDPENLHQHRVAARRTRAFLRAARGYVDPDWARSLADPLRELGRVTGPVRDLDVLVEHVRAELGTLDPGEEEGGDTLAARLEDERATARRNLLETLDDEPYRGLLTRLRIRPRLGPDVSAVPLDRIARKAFRRLVRTVDELGPSPDDAAVHRLRITLKRARYAAELSGAGKADRFLEHAKELQDLLGEHQDAVVAERRLRQLAVTDSSTAAAFVAGRIAERQRDRRRRVAKKLPKAWKRLRATGSRGS